MANQPPFLTHHSAARAAFNRGDMATAQKHVGHMLRALQPPRTAASNTPAEPDGDDMGGPADNDADDLTSASRPLASSSAGAPPMAGTSQHSPAHPGFQNAASSIAAKEGIPMANARRILAASARKASPAAKKANPRLNRVPGAKK